jgi:hypothetical protein
VQAKGKIRACFARTAFAAGFSAIFTHRHFSPARLNARTDWSWKAFHKFTGIITTTRFFILLELQIQIFFCDLLRLCISRFERNMAAGYFHRFPQSGIHRRTFQRRKKRVK